MGTFDLLNAIGAAQDEYIQEAFFPNKQHSTKTIRLSFIAALITLLLLLAGCAAWFYRLENLVLIDHTAETIAAAAESEYNHGPYIANQALSVQGYMGSPAYNALQEWLAYKTEYIRQNPDCRFQNSFCRPDAYELYGCYTQEMVDKADAICQKYALHIMGKGTFLNNETKMEEHDLTYVLSPDALTQCFYGNLFEDGSFIAEGELSLSGDYDRVVQFQMHMILKDAFYPVSLPVNADSYSQWSYKLSDGCQALMALNDTTGLIITENKDYFITVIVEEVPDENMMWHGLPDDKAFLESVCDRFIFRKA